MLHLLLNLRSLVLKFSERLSLLLLLDLVFYHQLLAPFNFQSPSFHSLSFRLHNVCKDFSCLHILNLSHQRLILLLNVEADRLLLHHFFKLTKNNYKN